MDKKRLQGLKNDIHQAVDTIDDEVLLTTIYEELQSVSKSDESSETIDSILVQSLNKIETLRSKNTEVTGIPSGFDALDRITYGWQNSDLIVIAGRPGIGKSAFALNLVCNAAMHSTKRTPVVLFSLEMSTGPLMERILSAVSEIWLEKIARGKLEEHEMKQLYARGVQRLAQAPLFIDDTPGLNIVELKKKCNRLKKEHNIGLVVVDYLQLMDGVNQGVNREQDISNITRGLKGFAKELQISVIAISQLSRAVEQRGTRSNRVGIPQLSDLRDSGAIEQDADMVIFLYRPEYYDIVTDADGENIRGLTEVKIAKYRNGIPDTVKLKALLHIQKFIDWDEDPYSSIGLAPSNWKPAEESGRETI